MTWDTFIATFLTGGLIGGLVVVGGAVVGFVLSAWITSLWVRLIITFLRKTLDREYGRMRGVAGPPPVGRHSGAPAAAAPTGPLPLRSGPGPRDW